MKVLILLSIISFASFSKDYKIVQAGKSFLKEIDDKMAEKVIDDESLEEKYELKELNLKKGDRILFLNRDDVSHNVRALRDDEESFNVRLQRPGKENDKTITVDEVGEYEVQCRIHPKMKLKLKVSKD